MPWPTEAAKVRPGVDENPGSDATAMMMARRMVTTPRVVGSFLFPVNTVVPARSWAAPAATPTQPR
jgi:hypothetical protein